MVRRRGVENRQAPALQCVIATGEQRLVLRRRSAPVGSRVRLVPDDESSRIRDLGERRARVRAIASLRASVSRSVAREPEDGEHDRGLPCCRFGARQLDEHRGGRPPLAVPGHPNAHRLRSELALPANDSERIGGPFQRVVVDTHEQPRSGHRSQREPRCDRSDEEEQDGCDQPPLDTRPRSDCRSTRQPVATTVRR